MDWNVHQRFTWTGTNRAILRLSAFSLTINTPMGRSRVAASPGSCLGSSSTFSRALWPVTKLTPSSVNWNIEVVIYSYDLILPGVIFIHILVEFHFNFSLISFLTRDWSLILPGQRWALQSCVSLLSPRQSSPPYAGAGLLQVLVLVWVPPPHSAEHCDHSPNSLHPPSTGILNLK